MPYAAKYIHKIEGHLLSESKYMQNNEKKMLSQRTEGTREPITLHYEISWIF